MIEELADLSLLLKKMHSYTTAYRNIPSMSVLSLLNIKNRKVYFLDSSSLE